MIPLKALADEALGLAKHRVERTLICNRGIVKDLTWDSGRDVDYAELRAKHFGAEEPCVWLRSEEPSYLLYTSGTTAQPKGIQRDTAGYAVALAASMNLMFAAAPGETMFTAADIGWAVGHSYGVYGPLIHGMQTVLYEGLPIRPDGSRLVRLRRQNC